MTPDEARQDLFRIVMSMNRSELEQLSIGFQLVLALNGDQFDQAMEQVRAGMTLQSVASMYGIEVIAS